MQQQKKAAVRRIASILAGIPLMTPSLREIVAILRLAAVQLRQRTGFEPDPRNRDANTFEECDEHFRVHLRPCPMRLHRLPRLLQ